MELNSPNILLFVCFFSTLLIGVLLVGPNNEDPTLVQTPDHVAAMGGGVSHVTKYDFTIDHPKTYDTATVYVNNGLEDEIHMNIQTTECYQCEMLYLGSVSVREWALIEMDTAWGVEMSIQVNNSTDLNLSTVCRMTNYYKENGNYTWFVVFNQTIQKYVCELVRGNSPPNAYTPVYVALGVLVGLAIVYAVFNQISSSCGPAHRFFYTYLGMEKVVSSDLGTPTSNAVASDSNNIQRSTLKQKPSRLRSLDAFRGLSLTIMIFVNYGSGHYRSIGHSRWNGLTVADLVYPWFIWIMGVSITLSFHAQIRHRVTRWTIFKKITKRFIILFGLGLILQGGNEFATFRVPGVLQRIAISYYVVALLHLISAKTKDEEYRIQNAVYCELRDILDYWYEWIVMLGLLALHVCLTFFLPVPGCPTGYIGPGGPLLGSGTNETLTNCTGGAANYIDKTILTYNHIYQTCTARRVYHLTLPHDPEGILGTLTAIFTAFLGLQAGKIFHLFSYPRGRILRFLAWCLVLGIIAGGLCDFSKEGGVIPLNKNLWSVSFTFATTSMAFFLLAVFYYIIDVKPWWTGVPVIFLGMNSIVVYCGSEIMADYFPFSWEEIYHTHAEKFAMNFIGATLWVVIAYYMYYIDFFVKI